jgi:allophanate hydrolase subunit 2
MGVRLAGPEVPGGEILSESPPLGALQITLGGAPIILLADRLRTAGYAKPAVVHPADLPRIAQLASGRSVRFRFVEEPVRPWFRDVDPARS